MIEILGWASTRAVARAFLETCEIATYDAESQTMQARQDIQLHPFRAIETISVTRPTGNIITTYWVDENDNPILDDQGQQIVTEAPEMEEAPGFHWNMRVFGDLEALLRANAPGGGDPDYQSLWNYSRLKTYIDNKLGTIAAQRDKDLTGARLPGGYEWSIGPNKVRLYDAGAVGQRRNVWA